MRHADAHRDWASADWIDSMPTEMHDKAHIDVFDRLARERWAMHFGVTEDRLRKAVRIVGSRVTTVAAYFGQADR